MVFECVVQEMVIHLIFEDSCWYHSMSLAFLEGSMCTAWVLSFVWLHVLQGAHDTKYVTKGALFKIHG